MKKPLRLSVLTCLLAAVLCHYSCASDELPEVDTTPEVPEAELLDAYHDKIRTQPYPKTNNEVYINPTPLIVPQHLKTAELLQFSLSQNADFNDAETMLSEPKAWCMFNPHKTLKNGTWYWRFRNVTAGGQAREWSQTYQFDITEETPRFLTPSFATFYNNAPHLYPRLYCFLDGRIDEARRKATSHPEYNALVNRAAGALTVDLSTFQQPYDHITEIKGYMQNLYQAYYMTQLFKYSQRMRELLQPLITTPPTDKQLFASNFGSTDIAFCFLKPYDLLYDTLTPDEKRGVENVLLRVLRYYYKMYCGMQENHIFDNHFWQHNLRVLFQSAFVLYDKSEYAQEVLPMLEYFYELWTARAPASGFNRDGVWHNGAGYFNSNVRTLYYMPMLFSHITRTDFLQHPWYQHAGQSMVYTWPPQSKSAGFGDGSEQGVEPSWQRLAFADFLARETGDSYAAWYATQCQKTLVRDYDMRLYRMASVSRTYGAELPADCPKFVWYKDAGEVAMHSDLAHTDNNLTLSFRSSTFGSGSHTLSNQNAFNLMYRGVDVYRSTGYYLDFSDAHNLTSYRHTRAHNTILVNGIGQPFSTFGYGNIMRVMGGAHITYCLGDASKAYSGITDPMWDSAFAAAGITQTPDNGFGTTPLTKYRRHILMLHPDIVLVYDELEASEPVRWEWLLHSPTEFYIHTAEKMVSSANTGSGFKAVTQLFSGEAMTFSQTDRFVVPPTATPNPQYPNQWHLTALVEGRDKVRFLSVIQVKSDGKQVYTIRHDGNTLVCGDWNITAELNASQPPTLTVAHRTDDAVFSYGSNNPVLNGQVHMRNYAQSSLLYDEANGAYTVEEQKDRLPASTRSGSVE